MDGLLTSHEIGYFLQLQDLLANVEALFGGDLEVATLDAPVSCIGPLHRTPPPFRGILRHEVLAGSTSGHCDVATTDAG